MGTDRLKVMLYTGQFQKIGRLGAPTSVECQLVRNGAGAAEVTFPASAIRANRALEDDARMVIVLDDEPLFSGPIVELAGKGPERRSLVTATVEDDWRLFNRVLGWPVPGQPATNQAGSEYATYTGSAEKIVKDVVTANAVNRLGIPVVVAPNQNRGATIAGGLKFRMDSLADKLFPAVENAGLNVHVIQDGANGLRLDVSTPKVYPRTLSEAAGTLREWEWSRANPTLTRLVVGGKGEGTLRAFRAGAVSARETQFRDVIEQFVEDTSAESLAELEQSLAEHLKDGGPTAGLKLTLSETKHFRFGQVNVGDQVTIDVGGQTITDRVRSASIEFTRSSGLRFNPVAGEWSSDPDLTVYKTIQRIARGLRITKAGK